MTAIQKQHGPFAIPGYAHGGPAVLVWHTVEDRLSLIKSNTDPEWLRAVIRDRDVQSTVRLAAERRLRKLAKS